MDPVQTHHWGCWKGAGFEQCGVVEKLQEAHLIKKVHYFEVLRWLASLQEILEVRSEEEEYCSPDRTSTIASISLDLLHNIPNMSKNDCINCLRFTLLHACWSEATERNVYSEFHHSNTPYLSPHVSPRNVVMQGPVKFT